MVLAGLGAMIRAEPAGALVLVGASLVWLLCLAHVLETRRHDRAKARSLEPGVRWRKPVKVAVFVASFVATMVGLEAVVTAGRPTGMPPWSLFPVVVVTPPTGGDAEIHIVYYKDLEEFCRTHPGASYLVPPSDAKRLHAQLTDGDFSVTQLQNGRQAFKVWKWPSTHDGRSGPGMTDLNLIPPKTRRCATSA